MNNPPNKYASPPRHAVFVLSLFIALASFAKAGVIAATDFGSTGSIPAIAWTPTLTLSTTVPASTSNAAVIDNNGTVDIKTNTGIKPVPVGVKTKAMSMNVNFSGVASNATSWSAKMQTPLLDITNSESNLARLNLSFDLSANRMCPVKIRIDSFNAANGSTGSREATVLPVVTGALYRYSLDLSTMTAGTTDFRPTGSDGDKIQISFTLMGNSTDPKSWPRGAGMTTNQVSIDNITYTSPTFYVTQNGGGNGATEASPAKISDVVKIANPGDVICLNPGVYTEGIVIDRIKGTPSRWITLRSTSTSTPAILRSADDCTIQVFAGVSYLNFQGLVVRGYFNAPDHINAGLTLDNATLDGEKINKVPGHETDIGYTIFHQDPHGRAHNRYFGRNKFNQNGISLTGSKKMVPPTTGSDYIKVASLNHEGVHHIRIADCIISENTGGGIIAIKGDYLIVENNAVYDNNHYTRYGCSGISSLTACNFDGGPGYKLFFIGNISHDNDGWVRWGPRIGTDGAGNIMINHNFSDGNGIIIDSHNIFSYAGRVLVQNNLIYNNGGSGIHTPRSHHVDIINNTAFRNSKPNAAPASVLSRRLVQQGPIRTTVPYTTFVDQTPIWFVHGGKGQNYGQIFAQDCSDVRICNNILWSRANRTINAEMPGNGMTNIVYDNNLFGRDGGNAEAGTFSQGFTSFSNNITEASGNPANVFANETDASNTATWLHLKTTLPVSPAINAGSLAAPGAPRDDLNGVKRPMGAAPDMGAYEDL